MKVLVLGGAGYIGSVLCSYLQNEGDKVTIYDNLMYEKGDSLNTPCYFINADIRDLEQLEEAIRDTDAVVHLAAMSNDPASELNPNLAWDVNYLANKNIARLCRQYGKRIVYASSCSVYGFSLEKVFDEKSELGPVTLYARSKMYSELVFLAPGVDGICLRFATVYGAAPKPRFDLVVNTMVGAGYFTKKLTINGGEQWRPIVHVRDVAQAVRLALHAAKPQHRVYNVGSNEQNYRITDLGRLIGQHMPDVQVTENPATADKRSYRANFDLIAKDLGFKARYNVADAVKELVEAFESGAVRSMSDDVYFRVKYLKKHPVENKRAVKQLAPAIKI